MPTRAEELEDMLSDPLKVKAMMNSSDPQEFPDFIKAYARSQFNKDEGMKLQIQEQVQIGIADLMKDMGRGSGRLDLSNGPGSHLSQPHDTLRVSLGKGAAYNKASWGARMENELGKDNAFQGSAEFFQAIWPKFETLKNADTLRRKRDAALKI